MAERVDTDSSTRGEKQSVNLLRCNMAGFQRDLTMAVTRQVQKIVIISWRRSWKRALAEEEEKASKNDG